MAAASRAEGGLLTKQDFEAYGITESAPISCLYRGYTILSSPPPNSGGVILCEMLQVLEAYPLRELGFHSSDSVHLMTEAMRHAIAPGKRPLSSMTPTIVLKHGEPVLVVGTPGGSRIVTTVLEIIVNVIDHGMNLQEAVDAPRIHHQ